jgi:hypothetical protein
MKKSVYLEILLFGSLLLIPILGLFSLELVKNYSVIWGLIIFPIIMIILIVTENRLKVRIKVLYGIFFAGFSILLYLLEFILNLNDLIVFLFIGIYVLIPLAALFIPSGLRSKKFHKIFKDDLEALNEVMTNYALDKISKEEYEEKDAEINKRILKRKEELGLKYP